jgi:hypothetical protein
VVKFLPPTFFFRLTPTTKCNLERQIQLYIACTVAALPLLQLQSPRMECISKSHWLRLIPATPRASRVSNSSKRAAADGHHLPAPRATSSAVLTTMVSSGGCPHRIRPPRVSNWRHWPSPAPPSSPPQAKWRLGRRPRRAGGAGS